MRRLVLITVLCAIAAVPALAGPTNGAGWEGGTASWSRAYYQGRGGEFTLYPSTMGSLLLPNTMYASTTKGQDGKAQSFQTFCLETDEYVDSNMRIWVSEASVNEATGVAGVYGSGSHAWQGGANTNRGDNLNPLTAYLYTAFATGNLSGYAYAGMIGGLTRAQTAGTLQRTIWYLESEVGDLTSKFMDVQLTTVQVALARSWLDEATAANWTDLKGVRVLQLYKGTDAVNQDQLYLAPVPGAVLLGLLGLGAAGLKLRRFL